MVNSLPAHASSSRAYRGRSFAFFADDIQLGYRLGIVGESLVQESSNRHSLRARLSLVLDGTIKVFVEPFQSILDKLKSVYTSSISAGDVEAALTSQWMYSTGFFTGVDLRSIEEGFVSTTRQFKLVRYQYAAQLVEMSPTLVSRGHLCYCT